MAQTYLKDPSNFLVDSGLLFEINRRILHPLGLALAVEFPDNGKLDRDLKTATVLVIDSRHDPEGFVFDDELLAEGQAKLEKFAAENNVRLKLMTRRASLGYVIQTVPPEAEPPSLFGGVDDGHDHRR